jgi:uncharacterized RDD family membrane protein YckC
MNPLTLNYLFAFLLLAAVPAGSPTAQAQAPEAPLLEDDHPAEVAPKKKTPSRTTAPHIQVERHHGRAQRGDIVEIGKSVRISQDETVKQLVVIAGNATIDGTVEGDLVVVSGSSRINGRVNGSLVTVLGSATLGPGARVRRDVVVVGGPLNADPQASVGGQQTVIALGAVMPNVVWLQNWLSKGLFMARPLPPQVSWVWMVAGLFLLVYLAMTLMFPRPVLACVSALEQKPVASFFTGILVFVLLGPLLFLLVVSVAGLLVIPFVFCALIAAAIFGKVAVYCYAGQQVGRQVRLPETNLPVVLLIGALLFYLIYMVPVLGFAVWGVVTLIGIGAVLVAAFGSLRSEEEPAAVPARGVPLMATGDNPRPEGVATAVMPAEVASTEVVLLPRVGFWRRFWAAALDLLLLGMLLPVTGRYFLVFWAAYHVAMWSWKGTTIGGIVLGIKIVRVDGQPINFAVALVRCLSAFFSAFALFIGFFWAGWDKERQAWHDKIAGTLMVKVPKGMSLI